MGLFRKSPKVDPAEVERLRAQVDELRWRVESTAVERARLDTHAIDGLPAGLVSAQNSDGVEARFGALTARLDRITVSGTQLDEVNAQITALHERAADLHRQAEERHEIVRAELTELRSVSHGQIEERLADLAGRLATGDALAGETAGRVVTLDERVTSVSTQLANQLDELGRDIDSIAALPSHAPSAEGGLSAAQLETLHNGQAKLAGEQARYEIAFRQDLASLAEQIRKTSDRR